MAQPKPVKLDFSDCTAQDFNHYFSGTLMVWQLTASKMRVFAVAETDGRYIQGRYLTRAQEWKPKALLFKDWWKTLFPLPHRDFAFNLQTTAALWKPNLHKNLKKSLKDNSNNLLMFGTYPLAGEHTSQNVLTHAFSELYGGPIVLTLKDIIADTKRTGGVTEWGFGLSKSMLMLSFKGSQVGEWLGGQSFVLKDKWVAKLLEAKEGIDKNNIKEAA